MIEILRTKEGISLEEHIKNYGMTTINDVKDFIKTSLKYGVVYTHSGHEFHADEVFALALLEYYRKSLNKRLGKEYYPTFKVIRDRNIPTKNKGLRIDVDASILDHHMSKEKAPFRENGIQYASVGLLWAIVGDELVPQKYVESVDFEIFEKIDACDNGIRDVESQYSLMISSFVPNWNESISLEEQMDKAIEIAYSIIERKIASILAIEEAKENVKKDYDNAKDKRIIILSKPMNWQEVLVDTEALFVIWKGDNEWDCQAVPIELGSFELKKGFNKEWRGYRNEELSKISGLNLIFCHSTGFYLVAKTKEDAIAACMKSLN